MWLSGPGRVSGVPIRTPGAVTADRRTVLPSQECRRVPGPKTVECHAAGFALTWRGRPPGRVRSKPKTPRAGRPGFGGLAARFADRSNQSARRGTRTSTSLDVARRRGPWVLLDPWRPARPRFFFRAMRIFQDDGVPGAAKKQGDSACLARTGQAIARRRRA
jgi:hypothetical protein